MQQPLETQRVRLLSDRRPVTVQDIFPEFPEEEAQKWDHLIATALRFFNGRQQLLLKDGQPIGYAVEVSRGKQFPDGTKPWLQFAVALSKIVYAHPSGRVSLSGTIEGNVEDQKLHLTSETDDYKETLIIGRNGKHEHTKRFKGHIVVK